MQSAQVLPTSKQEEKQAITIATPVSDTAKSKASLQKMPVVLNRLIFECLDRKSITQLAVTDRQYCQLFKKEMKHSKIIHKGLIAITAAKEQKHEDKNRQYNIKKAFANMFAELFNVSFSSVHWNTIIEQTLITHIYNLFMKVNSDACNKLFSNGIYNTLGIISNYELVNDPCIPLSIDLKLFPLDYSRTNQLAQIVNAYYPSVAATAVNLKKSYGGLFAPPGTGKEFVLRLNMLEVIKNMLPNLIEKDRKLRLHTNINIINLNHVPVRDDLDEEFISHSMFRVIL